MYHVQPSMLCNRMCSALNYSDLFSRDHVSNEHTAWGDRVRQVLGPTDPPKLIDMDVKRKLKIGYISPDFYRRARHALSCAQAAFMTRG